MENLIRYYNQIKHTHIDGGKSDGWETACGGHDTMEQAILCNEQSRVLMVEILKQYGSRCKYKIEQRIIKATQETVEEASEVKV